MVDARRTCSDVFVADLDVSAERVDWMYVTAPRADDRWKCLPWEVGEDEAKAVGVWGVWDIVYDEFEVRAEFVGDDADPS